MQRLVYLDPGMNLLLVEFGQKDAKNNRSEGDLDDLYVVLSPVLSVLKTDEYASVIKELGANEVTI